MIRLLLGADYLFEPLPHDASFGYVYRLSLAGDAVHKTTPDGKAWTNVYVGNWTSFASTMRKRAKEPSGKPVKARSPSYYVSHPDENGKVDACYVSGSTKGNYWMQSVDPRDTFTSSNWHPLMWSCTPTGKDEAQRNTRFEPESAPTWLPPLPQ